MKLSILAAEGGKDSQLFVGDLANSYKKFFEKNGWKYQVTKERKSTIGYFEIEFSIQGKNIKELSQESGGLRIKRIPTYWKKR